MQKPLWWSWAYTVLIGFSANCYGGLTDSDSEQQRVSDSCWNLYCSLCPDTMAVNATLHRTWEKEQHEITVKKKSKIKKV